MTPLSRGRFVERSIQGALAFIKEALFAEEIASRPGLLQSLDPRVKTATVLLFILAAMFTRWMPVLGVLYVACLGLALSSAIPLWTFLVRTWFFIPLFSVAIAFPAIFSVLTPGKAVLSVGPLTVTEPGLMSAVTFLGRVVTSVSFTVLLSLTTRHTALLKALRSLGVPHMFVLVLGMCVRYLHMFVEIVQDTYRAIQSRVGRVQRTRHGQKVVAWKIAHLWMHSVWLSERVYSAMISRGFRGEPVTLSRFRTRGRDWVWSACVASFLAILLIWERTS